MVYNCSNVWLKKKNRGTWNPILRERYQQAISNPVKKEKLQIQARGRALPISSILKELDKRKETYVLVRIRKDEPAVFHLSADIPANLNEEIGKKCLEISKSIAKHEEDQIVQEDQAHEPEQKFDEIVKKGVAHMRKKLSEIAQDAFKNAGMIGPIPWGLISSDQSNANARRKGPGFFLPKLCSPHNLNYQQCVAAVKLIAENGGEVKFWSHVEWDAANQIQNLGSITNEPGPGQAEHANQPGVSTAETVASNPSSTIEQSSLTAANSNNDQQGNDIDGIIEEDNASMDEIGGENIAAEATMVNTTNRVISGNRQGPQITLINENGRTDSVSTSSHLNQGHDLLTQACQEAGIHQMPAIQIQPQIPQLIQAPNQPYLAYQTQSSGFGVQFPHQTNPFVQSSQMHSMWPGHAVHGQGLLHFQQPPLQRHSQSQGVTISELSDNESNL